MHFRRTFGALRNVIFPYILRIRAEGSRAIPRERDRAEISTGGLSRSLPRRETLLKCQP